MEAPPANPATEQQIKWMRQQAAERVAELKQQITIIQQQSLKTMQETIQAIFRAQAGNPGMPMPGMPVPGVPMPGAPGMDPEPQPPVVPPMGPAQQQQIDDAIAAAMQQAMDQTQQAIDALLGDEALAG